MSLMKIIVTLVFILVPVYTEPVIASDSATLPTTERQLEILANEVCNEFYSSFREKEKAKSCAEKFLHPAKDSSSVPTNTTATEVQVVCHSQRQVMFRATTLAKGITLVILLPTKTNLKIGHQLLDESSSIESISRTKDNYSLWTTILDSNGVPSTWHRGPDVPWIEGPSHDYQVHIAGPSFEYNATNNHQIDATFRIGITGAPDACADVDIVNKCHDQPLFNVRIKLENHTETFRNLTLDTECTLYVFRSREKTEYKYQTPVCTELPGCFPPPETPENIDLQATQADSGSGWDVFVSWDKPRIIPDIYNVTLYADESKSVILNGNATNVKFSSVKGSWLYNVTIEPISEYGRAWNIARAFFPEVAWTPPRLALWAAGLALFSALAAALYWTRRSHRNQWKYFPDFPPSESTLPKECGVEAADAGAVAGAGDGWEVRGERLLVHELLGEGAFGVVRRGTLAPTGRDVAVKMLKEFPTLEEKRAFHKEMDTMKNVGAHPHVVSLVGCCSGRRPLIVVEYCSRGDLLSFLRYSWDVIVSKRNVKYYDNNNGEKIDYRNDIFTNKLHRAPKEGDNFVVNKIYDLESVCDAELTGSDLLSFCRQIAMGMEFLAANRLVHRDLAARNILVTKDKTLKIADFGLSRDVYSANQYKQKGDGKMPVKWMALESLTHRIYTSMTDVWSFGVVMWEIMSIGGVPYPDVSAARVPHLLRAGYRMPKPQNCSQSVYELMLRCWRPNPRDRLTFTELHEKLDELLTTACSEDYLTLEVDVDVEEVLPPKSQKYAYIKALLSGRFWPWNANYTKPWKALRNNHYSKTPSFTQPIAV